MQIIDIDVKYILLFVASMLKYCMCGLYCKLNLKLVWLR